MSPLRVLSGAAALRATSFAAGRQVVQSRTFVSTANLAHKESSSQNPDSQVDKHKADLLNKHQSGQAHWKPELASDSEEAVKADRSTNGNIKDLQDRTKHHAEETSKAGTSSQNSSS